MKALRSSYVRAHIVVILLILFFSVTSSYVTYIGVRNYYENIKPRVEYVPVIVYKNRTVPVYGESNFSIVQLISENLTMTFFDEHATLRIEILFVNVTRTYFYFNLTICNRTMYFEMWPKSITVTFSGTVKLEKNETAYIAPFSNKRVLAYSFVLEGSCSFEVFVQKVEEK